MRGHCRRVAPPSAARNGIPQDHEKRSQFTGALIERGADAAIAFVFDGAPITRRQFAQGIDQSAAWLDAHGIGKGNAGTAGCAYKVPACPHHKR